MYYEEPSFWDSLWETVLDMLKDWPLGTIIGSILLVCLAIMTGIIVVMMYSAIVYALDNWFVEHQKGTGQVVGKEFTPAHTQTTLIYNAALKMAIPQTFSYPNDWSVCVEVNGKQDWVSVKRSFYRECSVGTKVDVEYVIGRASRALYIKELWGLT